MDYAEVEVVLQMLKLLFVKLNPQNTLIWTGEENVF